MQKEIFVFIGPPGAGKGSLSHLCVKKLGWCQLSTGNLCRKHIDKQTELGKKIDFAIKSGRLVSDNLIMQMVEKWLDSELEQASAIILDGYPRTVAQAHMLEELLNKKFSQLKLHIARLALSDTMVVQRLCNRYICQNKECQAVYSLCPGSSLAPRNAMSCDECSTLLERRKDDEETAIRERLRVYHQHERELLDFYSRVGRSVVEVDVDKPLDDIFEEFKQLVGCEVS